MNERIRLLADKIWAEEYWDKPNTDKLLPAQLNRFAELIVRECCDWIDGSPANDAGQLHLTKSFIIANLKGMFRSKE